MRDLHWIADHNAEVRAVWDSFWSGSPLRTPVYLGVGTQFFINHDDLNPGGALSFERYATDAEAMLDLQLRATAWRGEHLAAVCDEPAGLPDEFVVKVDLQTYDDASFFGAPLQFLPGQVPDTLPILEGDRKNLLFDRGLPDPLYGGFYSQAHILREKMADLIARRKTFLDRPIRMDPFGHYTEGPLTVATALRGNALWTDLYDDPEYVHRLLDFITTAIIARIRAHRRFFGLEEVAPDLFFADDAIQLISNKALKEFLIPVYRKLKAGVTYAEQVKVHLCGDASRHFKTLRDEVGVNRFETGFPIDLAAMRRILGPEVILEGGPNIMFLHDASPQEVAAESRRILDSGVREGGRFILREANNLAPRTPLDNLAAMYAEARKG